MIDEAVRPATAADATVLRELERSARSQLVDQRGGAQLLAEEAAIGEWHEVLADPSHHVFVATLDGHVLGYLELVVDAHRAVVRQVYVDPEARELGLGDALLGAAMEAGRAAGCRALEGAALPGDRATKNLYERAGIVARKIIVSKQL